MVAIVAGPRPVRFATASSTEIVTGSGRQQGQWLEHRRHSGITERGNQLDHVAGARDAGRAPVP